MQKHEQTGEKPVAVNAQSSTLSAIEQKQLAESEIQIGKNLTAFTEVGSELQTIHDQQLYREKHKTWAEYCKQRWGFSHSYADRLIAAAKLAKEKLTPQGVTFTCEGELRKLVIATEDQFAKALEKAREKVKKKKLPLTAALVADQLRKKPRKKDADEKLHLPTDISGKLETLVKLVGAVIETKDVEKILETLRLVRAFLDELKK